MPQVRLLIYLHFMRKCAAHNLRLSYRACASQSCAAPLSHALLQLCNIGITGRSHRGGSTTQAGNMQGESHTMQRHISNVQVINNLAQVIRPS